MLVPSRSPNGAACGGTGAGGTDTPSGNGTPVTPQPVAPVTPQPVAPVAGGGGGTGSTGGGQAASPGQYPVGGVETGAGGWDSTLVPALTAGAALLLLGAGAGSLLRGRQLRMRTTSQV